MKNRIIYVIHGGSSDSLTLLHQNVCRLLIWGLFLMREGIKYVQRIQLEQMLNV
jgi:hypothetical protein